MLTYKASREALEEIVPVHTLVLFFQLPELWKNQFLLFEPLLLLAAVVILHYGNPSKRIHRAKMLWIVISKWRMYKCSLRHFFELFCTFKIYVIKRRAKSFRTSSLVNWLLRKYFQSIIIEFFNTEIWLQLCLETRWVVGSLTN